MTGIDHVNVIYGNFPGQKEGVYHHFCELASKWNGIFLSISYQKLVSKLLDKRGMVETGTHLLFVCRPVGEQLPDVTVQLPVS